MSPSVSQCTTHRSSTKRIQAADVLRASLKSHVGPQTSHKRATPVHTEVTANPGFPAMDASFPKPISSVSWLARKLLLPNLYGASPVKSEIGPRNQRAGRDRRKGQPLTLVGSRFNKQGNLHTRLVLVPPDSRSQHPPARILSFCRGFNRVQSCTPSTWALLHAALSGLPP